MANSDTKIPQGRPDTRGEPIAFGSGDKTVEVGTYGGNPAVFVAPAEPAGTPGELASPTTGEDKHRLVPGEWVMTFPTEKQAFKVADALCGRRLKRLDGTRPHKDEQGGTHIYAFALKATHTGNSMVEPSRRTTHLTLRSSGWEEVLAAAYKLLPGGHEVWTIEITSIHEYEP